MRRLKEWKKWLFILLGVATVIVLVGGWIYYTFEFHGAFWLCMGATIHNCVEVLLFNPILTIQDIVSCEEFIGSLSYWGNIFVMLYSVAVIVVPLVDILLVLSILDDFLHFIIGISWNKEGILVVGYNDKVRNILESNCDRKKIYLWANQVLSTEEERELFLNGISVVNTEMMLVNDVDKYKKQIEKFSVFLKKKKIKEVLLLDEIDWRNVEYYMALSSCSICDERTIHFYVSVNNYEIERVLEEFFDDALKNKNRDLRIFNYSQLQAEKLFVNLPLYKHMDMSQSKDIHLLVIGGGSLGEHIVIHAMNQGVFTSENKIIIDVIDKDISLVKKSLGKRFNKSYVTESESGFTILSDKADGELYIRFNELDIYDENFVSTINELQRTSNGGKFTYVAICLPKPEQNLHCITEFKKIMMSKVPIAIRMSELEQLKRFIEKYNFCAEVHLMGEREDYIGIEQIINEQEEREIRKYHCRYVELTGNKVFGEKCDRELSREICEREWNEQEYYRRVSNRSLFYHGDVKKFIFKNYQAEQELFWNAIKEKEEIGDIKSKEDEKWSKLLVMKDCDGENDKYPQLLEIAKAEHRRFTYFYASNGWKYAEEKKESKREHDCLCTWQNLVETKKNVLVYDLIAYMMEE